MGIGKHTALLCGVALTALASSFGTASGQDTILDPITIFGEKVERGYLETPTSVGVVTDKEIEDYAVTDVVDSFDRLANVRMLDSSGGNDLFSIRGLNGDGAAEVSNIVPLISTIIDGALQNNEGSRRGFRSTWDLEQIEVLRGPQSSLYGRAALAGALVLESKDPTYEWEGALRGDIGQFDREGGAFMLSGPIFEDQLAFRISGESRFEKNDINFIDPANAFFGEDEYENYRAKLLWEPSSFDGLRALFTFNHAVDSPDTATVSGPNFTARNFAGLSIASEDREVTVDNYIADVSYEFNEAYVLRSITAHIDTDLDISSLPSSVGLFERQDNRIGDDLTQEVRLEIDDEQGMGLSGVVGGFFGRFDQDTTTSLFADSGLAFGGPPSGFLIPIQVGTLISEIDTTAFYADLRYKIFDNVSIIGGIRYQRDEVRNAANIVSALGPSIFDIEAEFDVWLPKYGVLYEIDEMQTISFIGSRGYRSGFTAVENGVQNTIDPEFVWTHEIAYRYVSDDQATSFGINVFLNEYEDQQVSVLDPMGPFPGATITQNAGSSRSYGAEIEGRHNFGNGLDIFGSVGLLQTEFVDFSAATCVITCDGNEFPEAPQVTASIGGIYRHNNGFFVSADASFTGSYFTGSDINNNFEIASFTVVNAKAGFENENFSASVFVKNLFDEEYLTSFTQNAFLDTNTMMPLDGAGIGDSRQIGVEVIGRF
ncbi:MAG: TonB-dependent receptor [Pseudomonadota bacterium]